MARRNKDNAVDWDAIERQYRLGQKTNRQLGEEYGVDGSNIGRRAKAKGWVVDKAPEVKAVTNALLIQNASGNANPNATPSELEIKAAGQAAADVVLAHRKSLRRLATLRDAMMEELAVSSESQGQDALRELMEMVAEGVDGGDADPAVLRRRLERAIGLPGRIDGLKRLAEVDERIRKGEREAFGMDAKSAEEQAGVVGARIAVEFVPSRLRFADDEDES